VVGSCSTIATDGIVMVEETTVYRDREEFFPENGNGDFCAEETTAPLIKWLGLKITYCGVDPQLVNMLTGNPVLLDDDEVPNQIGYGVDQGAVALSNFAFEGWTRLTGSSNCAGSTLQYGYVLYPWVKQATISDVTYQNDVANFVIEAIAVRFSQWGVGPYNVVTSELTATLGNPMPLFTAITAARYKDVLVTKLAPPPSACGCVALPLAFLVALSKVSLTVTLTIPTPTATYLPATIDWGDGTAIQQVTSGTTVPHTYSAGGTYTVKFNTKNFSSAPFQGTITVP
jgi:hypothetical protein